MFSQSHLPQRPSRLFDERRRQVRTQLDLTARRLQDSSQNGPQLWAVDTRNLFRDTGNSMRQLSWKSRQARLVAAFSTQLYKLIKHMHGANGSEIQLMLPPLISGFEDLVNAYSTGRFALGRKYLRECIRTVSRSLGDAQNGRGVSSVSPERASEASKMVAAFLRPDAQPADRGTSERHILFAARARQVRSIWCGPEERGVIDPILFKDLQVEHFKAEQVTDSVYAELESFQRLWMGQGKTGVGRVFTMADIKAFVEDKDAKGEVLKFSYNGQTLGYCVLQLSPNSLSEKVRERIELTRKSDTIRGQGLPSGWLYLVVTNPEQGIDSPLVKFTRDLRTPIYPLMTSMAQDLAIDAGAKVIFMIVREGNPAEKQHLGVGCSHTGISYEPESTTDQADRFNILALPTFMPDMALAARIQQIDLENFIRRKMGLAHPTPLFSDTRLVPEGDPAVVTSRSLKGGVSPAVFSNSVFSYALRGVRDDGNLGEDDSVAQVPVNSGFSTCSISELGSDWNSFSVQPSPIQPSHAGQDPIAFSTKGISKR